MKQEKNAGFEVLRLFVGIVFLSAAAYRTAVWSTGAREMQALGLPEAFSFIVVVLELVVGSALVLDKWVAWASIVGMVFIGIALVMGLLAGGADLLRQAGELFVFDPTPTDMILHGSYLLMLLALFLSLKKRKKES
ncbi:MAG: DoxX family membrane protein [archaeon]